MATKKQRRRRAKEQRHDYMWVDGEGNEMEPDGGAVQKDSAKQTSGRFQREPQAPSWRRTLRRGAIFAPIMFATVYVLAPNVSTAAKITQTLLIVAIFVPFSYLMDRLFYRRSVQRRRSRGGQATGRRGS